MTGSITPRISPRVILAPGRGIGLGRGRGGEKPRENEEKGDCEDNFQLHRNIE